MRGNLCNRITQDVKAALLTKLGWKILAALENILVKVISTKYQSNISYFEAKKSTKTSIIWKYVLDFRYLKKVYARFWEWKKD